MPDPLNTFSESWGWTKEGRPKTFSFDPGDVLDHHNFF